jgi:hypothetical protein
MVEERQGVGEREVQADERRHPVLRALGQPGHDLLSIATILESGHPTIVVTPLDDAANDGPPLGGPRVGA